MELRRIGTLHLENGKLIQQRRVLELALWTIALAALIAWRLHPSWSPELSHDSFQYLSEARNAREGRLGYTSLVHFDAERSFGVIPAPLVTFPPGYASLTALVSLAGVTLETASLLISIAATWGCVLLIAWVSNKISLSHRARNVVMAVFVLNAATIEYSTATATEPLFTVLALCGLAFLVEAQTPTDRNRLALWVASGVAFGLAYTVRYAGLFFIVGLFLLTVRHVLANRKLVAGYATCATVAGLFAMSGMLRNYILVGNWRGGNEKVVSNDFVTIVIQTARALNGLFLGPGSALHGGTFVPRALCTALFIVGFGLVLRAAMRHTVAAAHPQRSVLLDILVLVAVYSACMFYAGLTSVISYDARMFVPLLPPLALLIAYTIQCGLLGTERPTLTSTISRTTLMASFVLYALLNSPMFWHASAAYALEVQTVLAEELNGKSARDAVLQHAGTAGVIAAVDGQAFGYSLQRPTLSLVGPHFSAIKWDEPTVRRELERFRASTLLVAAPEAGILYDEPSPFIRELARGNAPAWLSVVHRSRGILVYSTQK